MGLIVDITKFIERRNKRLDSKGTGKRFNMDLEVGNFPGDEPGDGGKKSGGGGSTRLPYGLCAAAGIDTTGMTPSEAWAALAGETGIKPKEAYKELKEKGSAKDLAKEAKAKAKETEKEKPAEVPESEKLSGSESLSNQGKKRDAADRFKAAVDMAKNRETVEKVLSGVPTGGVVRFIKIDKHGTISEHSSTAKKNADGTFTTKKGNISAELLSWWVNRDKEKGKPFSLEADDFTMPVGGEFTTPPAPTPEKKTETPKPDKTEAPVKSAETAKAAEPAKMSEPAKKSPSGGYIIPASPKVEGTKLPVKTTSEIDTAKVKTMINAQKKRDDWGSGHTKYHPYIEKMNAGMKYLFEDNEFCINFDAKNIESILKKGFLNQLQTAKDPEIKSKTHGSYAPDDRKKASQNMFGTPYKTRAADYEKYGYLGNPLRPSTEAMNFAGWYGKTTVLLKKDRVKNRVTYSYGDSLGKGIYAEAVPGKDGDEPSWEGAGWSGLSYTGKPSTMMRAVMDAPGKKSGLEDIVDTGYLELQYHGELTMSDVDTIVFRSEHDYAYVTPDVQEAFDALGIKVVKLWEKKKK